MSEQPKGRRIVINPNIVRVVEGLEHLRGSCVSAGLSLRSSGLKDTKVRYQILKTEEMVEAVLKDITSLTVTPEFFDDDRGSKETPPLSDGDS